MPADELPPGTQHQLKAGARSVWSLGDYPKVAARFLPAAEALVAELGVGPPDALLDVAAGNGNVAVTAARHGAAVTASDLSTRMLEFGRARSDAEGVQVEWMEADAEDLPFTAGGFDVVASAFGLMFAPRPGVAVRECRRVLRPGGRVGLTAWTPRGYFGRMSALMLRHLPLPARTPDPLQWGDEAVARERLGAAFDVVSCQHRTVRWTFPSPAATVEFLARHSPPHLAAARALERGHYRVLLDELEALTAETSRAASAVDIEAEYLLVVARSPR